MRCKDDHKTQTNTKQHKKPCENDVELELETHLPASGERLRAQLAFVWPFTGMDSHVQSEAFLNRKRFVAIMARELSVRAVLAGNMIF